VSHLILELLMDCIHSARGQATNSKQYTGLLAFMLSHNCIHSRLWGQTCSHLHTWVAAAVGDRSYTKCWIGCIGFSTLLSHYGSWFYTFFHFDTSAISI